MCKIIPFPKRPTWTPPEPPEPQGCVINFPIRTLRLVVAA